MLTEHCSIVTFPATVSLLLALQVLPFAEICGNLALSQIIPADDVGRRTYVSSLCRRISPLLGAAVLRACDYRRAARFAC